MDLEKLIIDLAPWIVTGLTIFVNYLGHRHTTEQDMQSDLMKQYDRVVKERDTAQARIKELEDECQKKDAVIDEIMSRRGKKE